MNVTSLINNKKKQFEVLIRPHLRDLYRRAYRLSLCQTKAEELVQDLLLKTYEMYIDSNKLNDLENIQGWFMKVLYNLYIDHCRRANNNPVEQSDNLTSENFDQVEALETGPMQSIQQKQMQRQISTALKSLNAEHKLLIVLHDMEGYSLPELSVKLDIPLGTLKSRLHRARQQMKKNLNFVEPFQDNIRLLVKG